MTQSHVLITGCSSGIGAATARRLADKGMRVYATARAEHSLSELHTHGCEVLSLDVTDEESMRSAIARVEVDGPLDALVNNAGYGLEGAVETLAMDDLRKQFETNVFGLVRLTQLVLPGMRSQRRGRIVNISSMGGKATFPGGGAYHASKYAVEAFSDALRYEVGGFGIKVSVIEPGVIKTPWGAKAIPKMEDEGPYATFHEQLSEFLAKVYSGEGAAPDDVAAVIERAIKSRRPRTRYPVTTQARAVMLGRRLLPDRAWDMVLRSRFPAPPR